MTREERAREVYAQAVEQLGGPSRMSIAADIRADTSSKYYNVTMAAMLTFADAEAAAMRERAAGVAENTWAANHTPEQWKNPNALCDFIAANIRALPATEEVG